MCIYFRDLSRKIFKLDTFSGVVYLYRRGGCMAITNDTVLDVLRTVMDPEVGMDVVTLGLVKKVDIDDKNNVKVDMIMTVPGCPLVDYILMSAESKIKGIEGIGDVDVNLLDEPWTPPWANVDQEPAK
jgi:metal-sulfur cluster biosynthetic enzyme